MPMIKVEHVFFSYTGETPFVLQDISFQLEPGECVALMGANGSGKTTLVRCLNGLFLPSKGEIQVDGLSVRDPNVQYEIRRKVGMVFQNPDDQIVAPTVEREIAFGLENLGVYQEEMVKRVEKALKRFHLESYRFHPPHLLSGGERQRLALASIWVLEPKYFILDEPTSLLDPNSREELVLFMENEIQEKKTGFLLVTQYPEEALQCDRLILLDSGKIVFDGLPKEGFRNFLLCQKSKIGIPMEIELALFLEGNELESCA